MTCLTDAQIQAAVDGEANQHAASHLSACARCRDRADERRAAVDLLAAAIDHGAMPPDTERRIHAAIRGAAGVRGATALRAPFGPPRWRRAGMALAAAAGVALVVYLVLPRVGAPTTLSAAEILGRSLQTLSAARGVELLEYELTIGGSGSATHRVEQLVDYDHPNRYRLATYAADGTLEKALSQDPFTGRRTHVLRVGGRTYYFSFTAADAALIPIPELARAQVEAAITMMQATSDQKLTVVDGGREYVIQMPPVTPRGGAGMLDLYQARAVVDGGDFRLREFQASGALLKQPYTISFRLIRRAERDPSRVTDRDFAIEPQPGDVVLTGDATSDPFGDLVATALRELARTQGQ